MAEHLEDRDAVHRAGQSVAERLHAESFPRTAFAEDELLGVEIFETLAEAKNHWQRNGGWSTTTGGRIRV